MNLVTVPPVALDPALAKRLTAEARKARTHKAERDRLIREAVAAGASLREVGVAVELTHVAVKKIVDRHRV